MATLIGIVTVTYNDIGGLARTIASVANQDGGSYFHIIVDGGSTDGTSELLTELKGPRYHVISEEDDGIYDAMNKGISAALSRGLAYVCFINSGDELASADVLVSTTDVIERESEDAVFAGGTHVYFDDLAFEVAPLRRGQLSHQAVFIPTSWHADNLYEPKLSIIGDRPVLAKAQNELKVVELGYTVAKFELGGVSNYPVKIAQVLSIVREISVLQKPDLITYILLIARYFLRFSFSKIVTKKLYFKIMGKFWFRA